MTTWRRRALVGVIVTSCWSAAADAATTVVRLTNGTTLQAELDPRTDEDQLWLRLGGGSTIVLRPIPWRQVAGAEYRGEPIPVEHLRELAGFSEPDPDALRSAKPTVAATESLGESHAEQARRLLGFAPRISAVPSVVVSANWDRDAQADGLLVQLVPKDAHGQVTAVAGVLDIELADASRVTGSKQAFVRRTLRIDPDDFSGTGVTKKLAFPHNHPEFDARLVSRVVIRLRLEVPGHGVFGYSSEALEFHPFAPLRGTLERRPER